MLVSGVQQSDSVIHIHVSILFQIRFPFRLLHNIDQSSLCYAVGPCWLSILNIAVCTCQSQTPNTLLNTFKCQHCGTCWVCRSEQVWCGHYPYRVYLQLISWIYNYLPSKVIGSQAKEERMSLNLGLMLQPGLCQILTTRA